MQCGGAYWGRTGSLGPQFFTLLVAGNLQRRLAFLPWVSARLKASKPKDWTDKPVTLGDHLKKARRERGLLQREVAKALRVDSMSLVNWEKNRTEIGARCKRCGDPTFPLSGVMGDSADLWTEIGLCLRLTIRLSRRRPRFAG